MQTLQAQRSVDLHCELPSQVDSALEGGEPGASHDASSASPTHPIEPYTGRFRSLVSSAPLLAPWSAPPAPTGFSSAPPPARGLPLWWSRAVRGGVALTLALMAAKAALLAGLLPL